MHEKIPCAWCDYYVWWGMRRTPEPGEESYSFKCPSCGQWRIGHISRPKLPWWKRLLRKE